MAASVPAPKSPWPSATPNCQLYPQTLPPDGHHILTASADSTTRLWNASTGELVHTYFASQTDNLALSWPARLQDFLDRRCTLRAIDPNQPIDLSKPRNWILQDQRLAERQPVRTWPLDVLISRYGDDESQALLAQAKRAG
jgi:WD40 repeat protein